ILEPQCDIVDAANQKWTKLSPEQKALDVPAVLNDTSLLPDTVQFTRPTKVTGPFGLSKIFHAGDSLTLLYYQDTDLGLIPGNLNELHWFKPDAVNLLDGARERLALAPDKRPSRL